MGEIIMFYAIRNGHPKRDQYKSEGDLPTGDCHFSFINVIRFMIDIRANEPADN